MTEEIRKQKENIKKQISEKFESMSRNEFIDLLEDVGFEVMDGDGSISYTSELTKSNNEEYVMTESTKVYFEMNAKYYTTETSDKGLNNFDPVLTAV